MSLHASVLKKPEIEQPSFDPESQCEVCGSKSFSAACYQNYREDKIANTESLYMDYGEPEYLDTYEIAPWECYECGARVENDHLQATLEALN